MALLELKRFNSVVLHFPFRGHFFMPADRDFGLIRRILNKTESFTHLMSLLS
jgi:hypothetical protein